MKDAHEECISKWTQMEEEILYVLLSLPRFVVGKHLTLEGQQSGCLKNIWTPQMYLMNISGNPKYEISSLPIWTSYSL
jgi:hypothetical protein